MYDKKLLFSGRGFEADGPYFFFDTIFDAEIKRIKMPLVGKSFTLSKFEEKYCLGGYSQDLEDFRFCPDRALITGSYDLCYRCREAVGFNPAWYKSTEISDRQRRYNEREHVVYLAHFGSGVVKVGMASKNRLDFRLMEQGARMAVVLKECPDAYIGRELEESIGKIEGFSEAVNGLRKRKLIQQYYDVEAAEAEILNSLWKLETKLGFKVTDPLLRRFDDYYLAGNKLSGRIIDLTGATDYITGKGVGLTGDILVMESEGRQFMTSLKNNYIGYAVVVGSHEMVNDYEKKPLQDSLF